MGDPLGSSLCLGPKRAISLLDGGMGRYTLIIANFEVKRVLIDTGCSLDIMFASIFDQLGISRDRLRPVATPLVGFNGSSIQPLGMIELPVLIGTHPQ